MPWTIFKRAISNQDQKEERRKIKKYDLIYSFFKWIYFVKEPNSFIVRKYVPSAIHFCMIAVYFDFLVLCSLRDMFGQWKLSMSFTLSITSSAATWFFARRNRESLKTLIISMQTIPRTKMNTRCSNLAFCVISMAPFVYALLYMLAVSSDEFGREFTFYTYNQYINEKALRAIVIFVKMLLISILYPTFTNLITLLFCKSCHHCCTLLHNLTHKIEDCSYKHFTQSAQLEILISKVKIIRIFNHIQSVFSLPTLLVCITNFSAGFGAVGTFVHFEVEKEGLWLVADSIYALITSIVPLTATIWTAGRVPIEAKKFRDAFCKKIESRVLCGTVSEDESLERCLCDTSDLVLTAGDIIYFRRSLILAFAGSILTYTFLLINTNN